MNKCLGRRSVAGPAGPLLAGALWLLLWLPVGAVRGQVSEPGLARLVRPAPGTRPLGVVLAELAHQGHLSLSYSSSLVPVAHPCRLQSGPARPLGVVLGEVLAAEHLSFGLLNGQLVLWPARVAGPAGVAAVSARSGRAAQSAHLPVTAAVATAAVPALGRVGGAARTATAGSHSVSHYPLMPKSGGPFSSAPTKSKQAVVRTWATSRPGAAARNSPLLPPVKGAARARGVVAKPRTEAIIANRPGPAHRRFRRRAPHQRVYAVAQPTRPTIALAGTSHPGVTRALNPGGRTGRPPEVTRSRPALPSEPAGAVRGPVAGLPAIAIGPTPVPESGGFPVVIQPPAGPGTAPGRSLAVGTDTPAPAIARPPFPLVRLLHPSYLHAEAWVSESLPLNAAVKVGSPRFYLVLGVAAGPPGHQFGGVAGGVGLGAVGRPRGRFTPSLDLLQWFLPGDRETPGNQLTQLRFLLAWQLRPGGRWQLTGGPALNLATGIRRPVGRIRGDGELGQGQLLWLDSGDEHSFRRLWPGVQLGLRF